MGNMLRCHIRHYHPQLTMTMAGGYPLTHKTFRFSQPPSPVHPFEAKPTQPTGGAAGQDLQSEPAGTEDPEPTHGFELGSVSAHALVTAVTHPGSAPVEELLTLTSQQGCDS